MGGLGGFLEDFEGIFGVSKVWGVFRTRGTNGFEVLVKNPRSLSTPKAEKFDFRTYFVFFTQFYGQKKICHKN